MGCFSITYMQWKEMDGPTLVFSIDQK